MAFDLGTYLTDAKKVLADVQTLLNNPEVEALEKLLPAADQPYVTDVKEGVAVLLAALDAV
jgi:hypothetical protein